ncbi:MAG: hypothetical protein B6U76_12005 [Desulfurococcales archaeon ex4484_217_2]|nr:MAG: hypothetical protein B6U76_12005 [Desulfurococcales archaeon ex4484_217_2]
MRDKPIGNKVVFFSLTLLITLSIIVPIYGSVYAYMSLTVFLNPISPPVWFVDPRENQVTVTLGPNRTSALVSIKTLISDVELTYNSNFYLGPDGWYFIPGAYLTNAYWLPSYQGALGVIEIYGTISGHDGDVAALLQNITIPSTSLSSLTEEIVYYYPSRPLSVCYVLGGLYDWETGIMVFSDGARCVENSWSEAIFKIDPSVVEPGKTYGLVAGILIYNLFLPQTYYVYYDRIELVAKTENPVYGGNWLLSSSDSGNYRGKLVVTESTFSGEVNATIRLASVEGHTSTPIVIRESTVVAGETSEIPFSEPPSGYNSLYFKVDASLEPGSSCTLGLKFVFRTEGAIAEYPITLSIHDPELHDEYSLSLKYNEMIPVYKLKSISLNLGEVVFED